jgi:hypothetical protein
MQCMNFAQQRHVHPSSHTRLGLSFLRLFCLRWVLQIHRIVLRYGHHGRVYHSPAQMTLCEQGCVRRILWPYVDTTGVGLLLQAKFGISEALTIESLKMQCTAAPFFGSDIGDGLRKVPAVAVKVLSVVLALAIGLVLGFCQDDGTVLSRSLAVPLSIFDANLNDVRVVGYHVAFGDGEAAIGGFHLDAMIGDAETDGKAKSL